MRLNLREFCLTYGEDPGNWSKLERGLLQAPSDTARLDNIGRKLNLSKRDAQEMVISPAPTKAGFPLTSCRMPISSRIYPLSSARSEMETIFPSGSTSWPIFYAKR